MKGIRLVGFVLVMLLALGSGIAFAEQEEGGAHEGGSLASEAGGLLEPTADSETFSLPDGRLETRIYPQPVNYRDEEGNWHPIGEDLREGETSALENGQNDFDLALPEQLDSGAVRVSSGDDWLSSELLSTDTKAAEVEDNSASYEADHGNLEFQLASLATGLKEDIVLADPSQPSKFSYLLKASAGLTAQRREDGLIVFLDSEGKQVFVLPAPIMLDSKPGLPDISDEIEYGLQERGASEWLLTVDASREWIESSERVWPIRLDPSLTVPSPSLDCDYLLYNTTTAKNVGCGSTGFNKLRAQYKAAYKEAVQERERSVLKFDTSSIPSGAIVTEATVGLFAPYEPLGLSGVELRRVTQSWDSSVTWTKSNATTNWTTSGGTFNTEGAEILTSERKELEGWWLFSKGLAPIVQGWVSGTMSNQGLVVKLKNEEGCAPPGCTDSWAAFNSSAATDSSKRPYLSVVYGLKPSATTEAASSVGETTATLKGQVNPNGAETKYQFEYGETTAYGTKAPATAESVGSGTTNVAVSKAISGLKGNTTYHYRVWASNASGTTIGEDKTFRTPGLPSVRTGGLEASPTSALLFGEVNPNGSGTTYQFELGPTSSYGSKLPASAKEVGSGTAAINVQVVGSGLQSGATYHYRLKATNAIGTVYGTDRSFTTPARPTVTTGPSPNTNASTGTLLGTVNPNQLESTFIFEYGTTTAYGAKTPSVETHVGSGETPVTVTGSISNLTPNTLYHYRVVAKNTAGTTYGDDKTIIVDQIKPNMNFASTYSAASPEHYGLDIQASDSGVVQSGLKSISILLNGTTVSNETLSCPEGKCPAASKAIWSHTFDHPLDGTDQLTVLTMDSAGNAASASFSLPSKVIHAKILTGDPAKEGKQIAQEWAIVGTHEARREDSTEVTTRGIQECPQDPTSHCYSLRSVKVPSAATTSRYSEANSHVSEPEELSEAATLLVPVQPHAGEVVGSGAISSIVQSWQTLPPGSGSTFQKIEANNEADEFEVAGQWIFWIDSTTGLPIKASLQEGEHDPQISYYTYESSPDEAGNLAPEFFLQAPPVEETSQCIPSGKLGSWSFGPGGFVNPDPEFSSVVVGEDGLISLAPKGAAIDGYEGRAALTSEGVELSTSAADKQDLEWEINASPGQILEPVGSNVVVESAGGSPSAVIQPRTSAVNVFDGEEDKSTGESGDRLILQTTEGSAAIANVGEGSSSAKKHPCITKSDISAAKDVQEEAETAKAAALGAKPSGGGGTTPVVVWINPHPALKGVTVTDKYGACNTPHSKTFGEDGKVEFGGCPVGKSVTLTVPSSVTVGSTQYTVSDSSRTFNPPSGGWRVDFNYSAQAPPPGNPPPEKGWYEPIHVLLDADQPNIEAGASSVSPLPEPPPDLCHGHMSAPFKSYVVDHEAAEAWFKIRCGADTYVDYWTVPKYRLEANAGKGWRVRKENPIKGPGPTLTTQGPYSVIVLCNGKGVRLGLERGPAWRSAGQLYVFSEKPSLDLTGPLESGEHKMECG